MELTETIDSINKQLTDRFGKYTDGRPRFRIIWSEDEFEKRLTYHTKDGFQLQNPIVLEVPKYRHYIRERYLIEMLCEVEGSDVMSKTSYECIWNFCDMNDNYLPPRLDAAIIVIETVLTNIDNAGKTKYVDENDTPERQKEELDRMSQTLFGNESTVGDALAHKYGVTVPEMPKLSEKDKVREN